ncbi:MAG: CRP/FNR family cyclic AMP-dependent transcriptional regulator [Parasphingorhabdus sp.]|jgi:CRP/FNR family cyclic AMP-dependent transcriptional regulator
MNEDVFKNSKLVAGLNSAQISQFFAAGNVEHRSNKDILIEEEDPLENLYVILDGEVEVYLPAGFDRLTEVSLAILGKGDCSGEYAFADQQPASATVRSLSDFQLFVIGYNKLSNYLSTHQDAGCVVYKNLLTLLVRRLRSANAELDLFRFSFDAS